MNPTQMLMVRGMATAWYPDLKKRMEVKKDNSGYEQLVKAFEDVYCIGVQAGLNSEARAWARVNELEDLIIDLLRYAPDSDVAKARIIERETFDGHEPAQYAKAVSIANGSAP